MKYSGVFIILILIFQSCQNRNNKPIIPSEQIVFIEGEFNTWVKLHEKENLDDYFIYKDSVFGGETGCRNRPFKNADTETFEVLAGTGYARDKNFLYYPIRVICVDYRDCGVCYFLEYVVVNADPLTFEYLDKDYAKDRYSVFYRGEKIDAADPNSFEVIKSPEFFYFARDKNNVFMHQKIFEDANPETFRIEEFDSIQKIVLTVSDERNKWKITAPNKIVKCCQKN